jgi:hypothetical protein
MKKAFLTGVALVAMTIAVNAEDCVVGERPHSQAYVDCVFYMRPTTVTTNEEMAARGSSVASYCSAAVGW